MSITNQSLLDPYQHVTEEFLRDPYPTYELLRNEAPIFKGPDSQRWLVSKYADVNAILRDNRFSSERYGGPMDERFSAVQRSHSNWMLMKDEPDHTRLRTLVNRAFTPATVEGLRSHIEGIATRLLDRMGRDG